MRILSTSSSTNHVSIELGERPNRKDYEKILNQERLELSYSLAKRRRNVRVERARCLVKSICYFLIFGSLIAGWATYMYFLILAWADDHHATALCTVASVSEEYSASSNSSDLYMVEISLAQLHGGYYQSEAIACFTDGNTTATTLRVYEYAPEAPSVNSTYKCWFNIETCEPADAKAPLFFYTFYAPFFIFLCSLYGTAALTPCPRCIDDAIARCLRAPEPLAPLRYSNELIVEFVLANWSRTYVPNGYDELNDDCIALDVQTLIFRFYGDDDGEDETT